MHLVLCVMLVAAVTAGCGSVNAVAPMGLTVTVAGPAARIPGYGGEAQDQLKTSASQQKEIPPEDIRSGYFKLDAVVYKLPVSCQEFLNQGWELDSAYAGSRLAPGNSLSAQLRKGNAVLDVTIGNSGDKKEPVTGLPVISLSIIGNLGPNDATLTLPDGSVVPGAGMDTLKAVYGEADHNYSSGPGNPYLYDVFAYTAPGENEAKILFRVDGNNLNDINSVTISNDAEFIKKQEQLTAAGTTIAEPTKEVAAYQVPTGLGSDITSGIIEFEGDLYRLPVPVSALQKNGWNLHVSFPSELEPGDYQIVYLSRGDKEMDLFIVNYGTETAVHSNCFADRWDTGTHSLKVAGIDVGASREALAEVLKGRSYEHDPEYLTDEDMYRLDLGYSDDFIRFMVSDRTNQVESVYIKKELPHLR